MKAFNVCDAAMAPGRAPTAHSANPLPGPQNPHHTGIPDFGATARDWLAAKQRGSRRLQRLLAVLSPDLPRDNPASRRPQTGAAIPVRDFAPRSRSGPVRDSDAELRCEGPVWVGLTRSTHHRPMAGIGAFLDDPSPAFHASRLRHIGSHPVGLAEWLTPVQDGAV